MQRSNTPKPMLLVAAAAVAIVALLLACPFSMMMHAQMTSMRGQEMPAQGMEGMCPLLCGVPPYSVGFQSQGSVIGPLPVHLTGNPASTIRPIFHPPTLS